MGITRSFAVIGTAICFSLPLAACDSTGAPAKDDGGGEPGAPQETEVVTHNAPGGGSDVFTRGIIEILRDEDIISTNWPVVNVPEGDSIGAMAYMVGKSGSDGTISQFTPTWLVTPLTVEGDVPTDEDLTPIAEISTEPMVVAAREDSPFETLADFIEAAQTDSDLVQVGGSTTATDSLTGTILKEETGADWKFLSFEDGGSRITAILRGDADVMFGSPGDFTEQVRAKKMKVITVFGADRIPLYEDAPTTDELGITLDVLPTQFRGILGAPDMPKEAVDYYAGVIEKLLDSEGWASYAEKNGLVNEYRTGDELTAFLDEQREVYATLLEQVGS